ncbi:MAG: phage Gp37/Gp68 family protein [Cyclobacteriaceae bacterium]|nr:MAG: phage Gp37/Gp68 family protein [Cyclobacteriaceae bacterium]
MNKTTIEWTDYTWNPVTGCTKVSQGCKNCYAETIANRFWGDRKFTDVMTHPERFDQIRMNDKKWDGKKVFVCSMSDLFHPHVPFNFIADVFREFWYLPNTTFQILTKRPDIALDFFQSKANDLRFIMPMDNVWIGTSCEDQATANERIPLLLQIPAAVRFLSCEPLLGPIDLSAYLSPLEGGKGGVHWVIAGGESGHGARPMHPDWVRSLRDQCASANVPFFFKQWGEWATWTDVAENSETTFDLDKIDKYKCTVIDEESKHPILLYKVGKKISGNTLDGKQHLEFPKL